MNPDGLPRLADADRPPRVAPTSGNGEPRPGPFERLTLESRAQAATEQGHVQPDGTTSFWVINTGASDHMTVEGLTYDNSEAGRGEIATANGLVAPVATGDTVSPIGYIEETHALPGGPNLLSLGRMFDASGYSLEWSPSTDALQTDPSGGQNRLETINTMPVMRMANVARLRDPYTSLSTGQRGQLADNFYEALGGFFEETLMEFLATEEGSTALQVMIAADSGESDRPRRAEMAFRLPTKMVSAPTTTAQCE